MADDIIEILDNKLEKGDVEFADLDFLWMKEAFGFAKWSECLRKRTGCVIVFDAQYNPSEKVEFVGAWNAPPRAKLTCKESGECLLGEKNGRVGCQRTIHAEICAILRVGQLGFLCDNATMYTLLKPCLDCAKLMSQAGIKKCIYMDINESIADDFRFLVDTITFVRMPEEKYSKYIGEENALANLQSH